MIYHYFTQVFIQKSANRDLQNIYLVDFNTSRGFFSRLSIKPGTPVVYTILQVNHRKWSRNKNNSAYRKLPLTH